MWEFLVALGVVVALVADAMAIVDSVRRWWEEKTTGRRPKGRPSVPRHRRMEAGDKTKPGGNRAS